MAIAVFFDKARAECVIRSIQKGKPIEASPEGWSGRELVALAGACYFAALGHGPWGWTNCDKATLDSSPRGDLGHADA